MHGPLARILLAAAALLFLATTAAAEGSASPEVKAGPTAKPRAQEAWSEPYPAIVEDLRAGLPLVTLVEVPLCSNRQIHCGGQGAGDPGAPKGNLYWGRGFGVRRYFDETARGWRLVSRSGSDGEVLEQAVYARSLSATRFGLPASQAIEHLLILRAVHGDAIESAVDAFYDVATHGGRASFSEGDALRSVRVHVSGYAGHNRLMDGYRLKQETPKPGPSLGIPAFVIACKSAPYFTTALQEHGSQPLVMTRDLVAPEGYVIEALVNALGDNLSVREVRTRVVSAYARWQRIPEGVASTIFAR